MASKKRRETEAEKAKREREERIELLKMKQGIIEESELIPENEHVKMPELHGWARFANFFYHNKVFILLGAFFVFVIGVIVYQFATREKEDLYILAVTYEKNSRLSSRVQKLELALERFCPDYDENGNVHVTVNFVDRSTSSDQIVTQYDDAQAQKLSIEFMSAEAQLYIADETYLGKLINENGEAEYKKLFLDLSDLCPEDMLFDGVGIRLNRTVLAEEMGWKSCPDSVIILIRDEIRNGAASVKKNAKNRERALTVLRNILDNNPVNPVNPGK